MRGWQDKLEIPIPIILLILLNVVFANQEAMAQTAYVGTRGETEVTVPRLDKTAEIDGVLDEPMWDVASILTGFSQYEPVDQRPAADTTQVLVWYSPTGIYFGIKAFDTSGSANSTLADRDKIEGDDSVQLLLDTFNDQRQALFFGVNPLGIQSDGNRTEAEQGSAGRGGGNRGIDLTPDYVFDSRGRLTNYGYEVEIYIPFESISYQSSEVQNWGINIIRKVQHSGYTDTWTSTRRGAASFLAQSGRFVGLRNLVRGRVVDFTPTLVTVQNGSRDAADAWRYASDAEIGGNLRIGFSANLTLDVTVNPDFSQVEADVGQVSSNERFALFFAEKRPFFLEGIDRFDTPNRLVYTRQFRDPLAGVKLTGKVAGINVGLLSGVDGFVTGSTGGGSNPYFSALRLRHDIGEQSTIGLAYTDRMVGDDYNRVVAADARLVFARLYSVAVQGGASFTRTGGTTEGAPIWEVNFQRTGRRLVFRYRVTGIHPEFRTQVGFVNRPGVISTEASNSVNFYGKPGSFFERWTPGFSTRGWWDYHGIGDEAPVEVKTFLQNAVQLRGGWSVRVNYGWESYGFDPNAYADYGVVRPSATGVDTVAWTPPHRIRDVRGWLPSITSPEFSSFSARFSASLWRDVGFAEARGVWLFRPRVALNWRPTTQFRLNLQYSGLTLDRRSDGSNMSIQRIPRLSLEYQLSRFLFVRLVGQYDSNRQDGLRAGDTDEPIFLFDSSTGGWMPSEPQEDNDFTGDILLSYRPNPGTILFLGYGAALEEPEAFHFRRMERGEDRFFMKLSYLFRR